MEADLRMWLEDPNCIDSLLWEGLRAQGKEKVVQLKIWPPRVVANRMSDL